MSIAIITGASAGLGRELAIALAERGWTLLLDGRDTDRLAAVGNELPTAQLIAGDVSHATHRAALARRIDELGGLDLLVNNASRLPASPQPPLAQLAASDFSGVLEVNLAAPAALTATLLPALVRRAGVVVNISSDAAVEHYPGWGAYGASKAALDHLTATFAVENPDIAWYAVDPGDMNTELARQAFPGEDLRDRPSPAGVVPGLLALLDRRPPSGRYLAADLIAATDQRSARRERVAS